MKKFITDTRSPQDVTDAATGAFVMRLDRYGVWGDTGRGKPQVIETGDDLDALLAKHELTLADVFVLPN